MVEIGSGPPLVLIPGVQGRWEWIRPTVNALAEHFRVITFTLAGDPGSTRAFDPGLGFDNYVMQVDRALDERRLAHAVVCGVSYGGLVALRYAATRPRRTSHLVLASALAPGYAPDAAARLYCRAPRLLLPALAFAIWRRTHAELRVTFSDWSARTRFRLQQMRRVLAAPASPACMRRRLRLAATMDFFADAAAVRAPVLVVTGDSALDRVVPVEHTRTYARLLSDVTVKHMPGTGHLGTLTRPREFAALVVGFVGDPDARRAEHGHLGRVGSLEPRARAEAWPRVRRRSSAALRRAAR